MTHVCVCVCARAHAHLHVPLRLENIPKAVYGKILKVSHFLGYRNPYILL